MDLGTRLELVPMDPHFHEITIALYGQDQQGRPCFRVHTYSPLEGARERLEAVVEAMVVLGGAQKTAAGALCFPCGQAHPLALRRLFLEACKLGPDQEPSARPLSAPDKKSGGSIIAASLGHGLYQLEADGDPARREGRVLTAAGGLVKLAQMEEVPGHPDQVRFPCGQAHDALVGLLLPRALNVRAALREQEQQAGRGVLAAPSQQQN
jgi:hypothetical protein